MGLMYKSYTKIESKVGSVFKKGIKDVWVAKVAPKIERGFRKTFKKAWEALPKKNRKQLVEEDIPIIGMTTVGAYGVVKGVGRLGCGKGKNWSIVQEKCVKKHRWS